MPDPLPPEAAVVSAQLGRAPREPWRVAVRCPHGRPRVIASPSQLAGGDPFPTTFWLTCPLLAEAASQLESAGGVALWEARIAHDPALAERALRADGAYRDARAVESGGVDACAEVGVGGVAKPLTVKCLHARLAAFLAGVGDPVGEGVALEVPVACEDGRCARIADEEEST
jgi:hypothetical protein